MKRLSINAIAIITAIVSIFTSTPTASAQYYEIANQIPGLLQPMLSGSMNYKGYVEATGIAGFGNNRACRYAT